MSRALLTANLRNLRPGLLAGPYPQRDDRWPGWTDRIVTAAHGLRHRLRQDRQTDLQTVSDRIETLGAALAARDRAHLDAVREELRRRFRSQGLSTRLCLRAFALIRELGSQVLGKRHFREQLMCGWVLLRGELAEMATGEGKTLAVTLPAATAALAGIPVHVITVNDYLVRRDAQAMAPLYQALGLSVGYVTQDMPRDARQLAYASDITYCTNKQIAFDYLRDRLQHRRDHGDLRRRLQACRSPQQTLLRGLCFGLVDEADSVLIDEAGTPLILTRPEDTGSDTETFRQVLELARNLTKGRDFRLDPTSRSVELTSDGQHLLADRTAGRTDWLAHPRQREELVRQGLRALHLLQRDRDYLVRDGRILLIDAHTGRTMPDRSWERGLQQLVETLEDCPPTQGREQLGRLTYQSFFRRYLHLAGMTGTAREVRRELWSVYGLRVQGIPLRRPCQRRTLPGRVFDRAEQKWQQVVQTARDLQHRGVPVLIGTASVAESEELSRHLTEADIKHRVLNARQDHDEAAIIARAGMRGHVTVATSMAGRGTDIELGPGVAELGGLHVIATCRSESARVDRQFVGRCARQGDPGVCRDMLSLDDDLLRRSGSPLIRLAGRQPDHGGGWKTPLLLRLFRFAQLAAERRHRRIRTLLVARERETGHLLAFTGQPD